VGVAGTGVEVFASVGTKVAVGRLGVEVGSAVGVAVGAAGLQAVAAKRSVTRRREFLEFISTSQSIQG
jgi:hypothetical protein